MICHGENILQPINKRMYFLNSCRISGHFDAKFTRIAQIEKILQEYKDPKIDNILNLERVYFLVTRVMLFVICWIIILHSSIPAIYNCQIELFMKQLIVECQI